MAESVTFAIELQDETSGSAKAAAGSLQNLKEKIQGDIGALKEMQSAMRTLKGGTSMNVEAYKQLKESIAAKHASIAKAQEQYITMGGTFGKIATASESAGSSMKSSFGEAAGQSGVLGNAVAKMSGAIGGGLVAAAVAAAVAVLALGTAIAATVYKMAQFGLKTADSVRAQKIQMQGLASLGKAYRSLGPAMLGGGMWAMIAGKEGAATREEGDALLAMAGRITDAFAVSGEQVTGYARTLLKARFAGADLEAALGAAATLSSTIGEEAASSFISMASQVRMFGGSVKQLAANVEAKFGDMARDVKLGFGEQMKTLSKDISRIFAGLKIEGFLRGLKQILSVFSQSTAMGRALKTLTGIILQPLFNAVERGAPIIKAMFREFLIGVMIATIGVLKAAIWVKSFGNTIKKAFGIDGKSGVDLFNIALKSGEYLIYAIAGAIAFVVASLALVAYSFVAAYRLIKAVILGIWEVISATAEGWGAVLVETFRGIGTDIVGGFLNGVTAMAGLVRKSFVNLAKSIKGAFTGELEIHSPSRAFARYAVATGEGYVGGLAEVQPRVESAVAGLVTMPSGSFQPTSSPVYSSNMTQNKGNTTITINVDGGGKDASGIANEVIRQLEDALEGEITIMGAPLLEPI